MADNIYENRFCFVDFSIIISNYFINYYIIARPPVCMTLSVCQTFVLPVVLSLGTGKPFDYLVPVVLHLRIWKKSYLLVVLTRDWEDTHNVGNRRRSRYHGACTE